MTRILIHEPVEYHEACRSALVGKGSDVISCHDREALVNALGRQRPDVIIYVIQRLSDDLPLLAHLRRVAPTMPIILLGGPTDLTERRAIQELKPTYYGVLPLEESELNDAVRGALHRSSRG